MSTESNGGEKTNSEQGGTDEEIIRDFVGQLNQLKDRIEQIIPKRTRDNRGRRYDGSRSPANSDREY